MITTISLQLPSADGTLDRYTPGRPSPFAASAPPPRTRVAYAAAHVVWPLLWIGFLIAIVMLATGTFGRGRPSQRR